MARSIHTTWSNLKKELKRQKSKEVPENKDKIDSMYDNLYKKRRIKKQIIRERIKPSEDVMTDPNLLPIMFYDENEYVHYPLTEQDIRSFIAKLPKGIIDGIQCIELRAGYGREKDYHRRPDPDPYTGRAGYETLPGVYQPKVLGTYFSREKVIELYAYVYKTIPEFNMWNVCLKIYMLMTLAHELSHHFDFQFRMGRGRWLNHDHGKIENYAETTEYQWLNKVILPYIEETYSEEVSALNEWIKRHAGIPIPLSLLAGDPRKTLKNGWIKLIFAADDYFYDFVRDIYAGKNVLDARNSLAKDFHYAGLYDIALEVIETVLGVDPKNIEALTLKADIYVHQNKYKEAEQIVRKVLAIQKDEFEAWNVLCDIYHAQADWTKHLTISEKALALSPDNSDREYIILDQIRSLIEIGQLVMAEGKLKSIKHSKRKFVIRRVEALEQEIASKKEKENGE